MSALGETATELREWSRDGWQDDDPRARWPARAIGLGAPAAPAVGDLPPNGTGWLISASRCGPPLHPRLLLTVSAWAGAAALVVLWSELLAGHHPPLLLALLVGALFPLVIIATATLAARWGLQRRLAGADRPARLADATPGRLVRVTGVIADGPATPTLFRGVTAVLFRCCVGSADELRGFDFDLALDDGTRVRVCVRRAFLLDRPTHVREPPTCGPVYAEPLAEGFGARLRSALVSAPPLGLATLAARHECSVGPGDRVEVAGVLHHELAPDAAAPYARLLPTRHVLRAGVRLPLVVRPVSER